MLGKQIEPRTIDDVVGMLVWNSGDGHFYYTSLKIDDEKLEAKVDSLFRVKVEIDTIPWDIAVIPEKGIITLEPILEKENGEDDHSGIQQAPYPIVMYPSSKFYSVSIYSRGKKESLIIVGYANNMYWDDKYLYYTGLFYIRRINLKTNEKESIIERKDLKKISGLFIHTLRKKDDKWYILVTNRDWSLTFYSADNLKKIESWKKVLHFKCAKRHYSISFDFLKDGSIVFTLGQCLYISRLATKNTLIFFARFKNKIEKIEQSKYGIDSLRVLPIDSRRAMIFYAVADGIWYASLTKENERWKCIERGQLLRDPYKYVVELITREGYEKVVKYLI